VYANALGIADPRTRTILRLAAELGMRRFEIAQINTRDLAEDLFGPTLRVHGKGHKVRILPIPTDLAKRIEEAAGWLFPGNENGHLSARRVGELGRDALTEGWTLHTLRHRFATRAHRATADLLSVQRLLGHSSPATTQRYIARDMERLRNVMAAAG
jgi:integrase